MKINPFQVNQYTPKQNEEEAPEKEKEQLKVSRELDGVHDTGVIGELLTTGTNQLSDANRFFLMEQFQVSGLLAEDNEAVSTKAHLIANGHCKKGKIVCADDMYVAGDPGVGGKGNDYQWEEIIPNTGYITMLEDGVDDGRKVIINSHVEEINEEKNTAFTEYGFIVTDDEGGKTKATLSGGQLLIESPDGTQQKLAPGNEYIVGDPQDPVAKFYYGEVPGGENGANETRLIFEHYEKPSEENIQKLVQEGVSEQEARDLRTRTQATFGFRIPDELGAFRMSEGVAFDSPMKTTKDGVKTYYDAHFSEGECKLLDICPPEEPPEPPPEIAENEHARIWGDPHVVGADGGKYDFMEHGIYSILDDTNVTLNSRLDSGPGKTTIITESGLSLGAHQLLVRPDGTVTLNDEPVEDGTRVLSTGDTITRNGNTVVVETTEYKIQFKKGSWKGFDYQNIDVWSRDGGVVLDGTAPTGIVGETFDEDDDKVTGIKLGDHEAYRADGLFASPLPEPAENPFALPPDPEPMPPEIEPAETTEDIQADVAVEEEPVIDEVADAPVIEEVPPAEEVPVVDEVETAPPVEEAPVVDEVEAVPPVEETPVVDEVETAPPVEEAPVVDETAQTTVTNEPQNDVADVSDDDAVEEVTNTTDTDAVEEVADTTETANTTNDDTDQTVEQPVYTPPAQNPFQAIQLIIQQLLQQFFSFFSFFTNFFRR